MENGRGPAEEVCFVPGQQYAWNLYVPHAVAGGSRNCFPANP